MHVKAHIAVILLFIAVIGGFQNANAVSNEEIEAVARSFADALVKGDEDTVQSLLDKNVKVLEGGHAQLSRDAYMAEHMKLDMAFLASMEQQTLSRKSAISGDLGWVTTYTALKGTYNGQLVNNRMRELLVMERRDGRWQITLVEWEALSARPAN